MSDIRVIVEDAINDNLNEKDQAQLVEHILKYAEHGFIEPNDAGEIYVDSDLIHAVHLGIREVQAAAKDYGYDEHGFVKYPFV